MRGIEETLVIIFCSLEQERMSIDAIEGETLRT